MTLLLLDMCCAFHHFILESDILFVPSRVTPQRSHFATLFPHLYYILPVCTPGFVDPPSEAQVHGRFSTIPPL